MSDGNAEAVELDVARARAGDRSALESVVRAIQKDREYTQLYGKRHERTAK